MQLADNIVWISGLRNPTLLKNNDSWSLDAFGSSNQQAYIFFFNVLRVLDFSTSCHGLALCVAPNRAGKPSWKRQLWMVVLKWQCIDFHVSSFSWWCFSNALVFHVPFDFSDRMASVHNHDVRQCDSKVKEHEVACRCLHDCKMVSEQARDSWHVLKL